jgi:hypothetical protein
MTHWSNYVMFRSDQLGTPFKQVSSRIFCFRCYVIPTANPYETDIGSVADPEPDPDP